MFHLLEVFNFIVGLTMFIYPFFLGGVKHLKMIGFIHLLFVMYFIHRGDEKGKPGRMSVLLFGSRLVDQWLFLVPLKGGRWHIIPQVAGKMPLIYHL